MKITGITQQKYRKNYRSIFIDGDYRTRLHEEVVAKKDLREGMEVDEMFLHDLAYESEKKKAAEYGFLLLSYRARSEKETRERLRRKGFSIKATDAAVQEFKQSRLLDDLEFARGVAESEIKNKLWGERRVRQDLMSKGIQPEVAEQIIAGVKNDGEIENEEERCYVLLRKRSEQIRNADPRALYRRLHGYLLRRGFSFETAEKALHRYRRETDKCPAR